MNRVKYSSTLYFYFYAMCVVIVLVADCSPRRKRQFFVHDFQSILDVEDNEDQCEQKGKLVHLGTVSSLVLDGGSRLLRFNFVRCK